MQKNIELFDYYAAIIFDKLIDDFPIPCNIEPPNLTKKGLTAEEVEKHSKIIYYTVLWLRDNGFINIKTDTFDGFFFGVILTSKGLEILKQVPESINGKSLGDNLKEAVKVGKDELIKQAANKIFSISLAGLNTIL